MTSTYVNDLRLEEIGDGDQSGTWGATTNTNLELIAEALSFGTEAITTNADTHTTTIADGATDPGRSLYLKYTGTLDSTCTITIGPNTISKTWYIENGTSGSQSIIISQGSGANVTIPTGQTKIVYSDGAGSGAAMAEIGTLGVTNLNVSTAATVATLDTSGAVNLNLVTDSTSSTSGALIVDGGVGIAKKLFVGTDLDVDGTANLDAVDIDGAVQLDATLTVGADDQGYDVILYGDTASANVTWDTSADDLILSGAAGLIVPDGKLTLGSTAVTSTGAEVNILDGVTSTTAELNILDGVTSNATEINTLDALSRGSIIYGNASAATTVLTKGTSGHVLTAGANDISWAAVASGGDDVVFPNLASPDNTYTSSGTWSKGGLSDDDYVWMFFVGGGGGGGASVAASLGYAAGGIGSNARLLYGKAKYFNGASYVIGAGSAGSTSSASSTAATISSFTLTSTYGSVAYSTTSDLNLLFVYVDAKVITQSTTGIEAVVSPASTFAVPTAVITGWSGAFTGTNASYSWTGGSGATAGTNPGGNGVFGGGGGGGKHPYEADMAPGGSLYAGAGGAMGATGTAGTVPGGGGGGSTTEGQQGASGGNGNLRVYHV